MKDNRGIGTAGALIILIVIVVLGIVGMLAFKKENKKANETANSQASLASVIDKVKTNVPKKFKAQNVVAKDTPDYAWSMVYNVPGYDSLVLLNTNTTHVMLRAEDARAPIPAKVADEVINQLKGSGFIEVSKAPVDPKFASGDTAMATYFSRKTDVCHLTIDKTTYLVTLDCAPLDSFKKAAKDAKPFMATYIDTTQARAKEYVVGAPKVATTKAGDYNYASMYLSPIKNGSGGTAYFYKAKVGDIWHYQTTSQQGIPCDSLKTPAKQAAFADICTKVGP